MRCIQMKDILIHYYNYPHTWIFSALVHKKINSTEMSICAFQKELLILGLHPCFSLVISENSDRFEFN